jgi:hypothetical protein
MEISELLPTEMKEDGVQEIPITVDLDVDSTHKPILQAHIAASEAYETLTSEITRKKVRQYLAKDPTILQAEAAIEQQYQLALSGDLEAMEKVRSGMDYWLKLMKRSMGL